MECSYWNKLWPVFTITKGLACNTVSRFGQGIHQKSTPEYCYIKNICKCSSFIVVIFRMFWNIVFSALISNFNISFISVSHAKKKQRMHVEVLWQLHAEASLNFSQFLSDCQSCTLQTHSLQVFFYPLQPRKREQNLLTLHFIARFCNTVNSCLPTIQWHFLTSLLHIFFWNLQCIFLSTLSVFSQLRMMIQIQFGNTVLQIKKKVCLFRFSSFLITASVEMFDSLFPFFHQHFTVLSPFASHQC